MKNVNNIKKALLSMGVIGLLSIPSLKAQESQVGIKGGINFSNFRIDDDEADDQNLRTSFQAGLFFKAAMTEFFAIQPELLYTTKGSTVNYNFLGEKGGITQKLTYIEVPILAVINLTENLNIHAGPYVAYLLKAKIENDSDNDFFDFSNDLNEDNYQRIDYGIAAGIGIDLNTLHLGVRYDYGLNDIGKDSDNDDPSIGEGVQNSTFSIFVGLGF